ncbi:hypothetical protein HYU23_00945 [Candidatus Woesearchaeota archaeon]|nr:hypothetical protein [Candidatus Woesearchaeota archaeon]
MEGDPIIRPVKGYSTKIDHILIYQRGDAIFYLSRTGESRRFDITSIDNNPVSESARHGLPCDRLISLAMMTLLS